MAGGWMWWLMTSDTCLDLAEQADFEGRHGLQPLEAASR
jgi:hypothetical protein